MWSFRSRVLRASRLSVRRQVFAWAAVALLATPAVAETVPDMRIHFIDVGQGDATLIEFPCAAVLVDAGGERNSDFDGSEALTNYLDRFFAARPDLDRTLALLAITHPHADHTLGIRDVLRKYRVENAIFNGKREGSGWDLRRLGGQKFLTEQVELRDIPHRAIAFDRVSDVRARHDGVIDPVDCRQADPPVDVDPRIEVLWGEIGKDPGWGYEVYKGKKKYHFDDGNNHSLVIRVEYGRASLLLTGDLETAAIPDLLRRYKDTSLLDVDVYQAGHHGSSNGTSRDLLRRMSPKLAAISMGPSSRECRWRWRRCYTGWQHGHPRRNVVEAMEDFVSLRRKVPVTAQVATAQRSFESMSISKCLYATGWGGTVIVAARASDGWIRVEQPLGQACGSPPPPLAPQPPVVENLVTAEAETEAGSLQSLAAQPLCEASAALHAPWNDDQILVADNELDEQLFVFSVADDRLKPELTMAMPGGKRPRDVEALVRLGDSLLVVGSHSRNKRCEEKSNRQRLRLLGSRSDGSLEVRRLIDGEDAWTAAREGEAECLETLFTAPPPALAAEACRALLDAERVAEDGESCPVLNVEGAFGTETQRVWLGLRAPLAAEHALLLRFTPELDELRFDRVALLDLEGRGVRELAVDGGTVYGIAGPVEDASDPFALFKFAAGELDTGDRLRPEILSRDLETSSEGMVIAGGHAWITVDGDGKKGEPECKVPSRQYPIELPGH